MKEMNMRSSSVRVTFQHPFNLCGCPGELPAGNYEVLIYEDLLRGHGFEAYQRAATYMTVPGSGGRVGWMELRVVNESDLNEALNRDQSATENSIYSEAALPPQEDLK